MHHLSGVCATLSWLWLSPSHRNSRIGYDIVLVTALTFWPYHLSQLLTPTGGFGASGLHDVEQLVSSDCYPLHLERVLVFG